MGSLRLASIGAGLALGLPACEDARAPLDLDALVEPGEDCVTLVHEALDPHEGLHKFVADGLGSPGGWALISFVNDNDLLELGLARIPATAEEAATPIVGLGMTAIDPDLVDLRSGTLPGELWVLSRTSELTVLRRLEPELGQTASNGSLGLFPAQGDALCPEYYRRNLVLIEGRPHLLAIPNCSPSPALDLQLVALDRTTLDFGTSWQLSFDPCAGLDPTACAQALAYSLAEIGDAATNALAEVSRVAVGFVQVRAYLSSPTPDLLLSSDVSLLDMRLTETGPTARLVTFRGVWDHSPPISLATPTLAQDPYSTLIQIRNLALADDSALLRFDTISDLYVQLRDPELMPFAGRGRLIQLGTESAIVDLEDGVLRAAPLLDIASWPEWMSYDLHEDPELLAFEPAGVGHLLLRRGERPAQVLRVSCLATASN